MSLKVTQAAGEGRRAPVLRLLVMVLSAATVVANASAVPGLAGRVLHAVPPAMFVICFESVIITERRRALRANEPPLGSAQLRPHPLRWVLAPRNSWHTWRTAILCEDRENHVVQFAKAIEPVAANALLPGVLPHGVADLTSPNPPEAKLAMALDALREDPQLKAGELRAALVRGGIDVSLRTAQRLRAAARRQLSLAGCDASDLPRKAEGQQPVTASS